jgi:hypothetical protein
MNRLIRVVGKALPVAILLAWGGAASAQVLVVASSNDNPNNLVNAIFASPTMTYGAEIANTGSTSGLATSLAFNQARLHTSTTGCSMLAMTNNNSNNVSMWVVNASGGLSPMVGSPFATGAGTQSLAWAPDGSALYVPLAVAGTSTVVTLNVSCNPGTGDTTVTNAGSVTLAGFNLLRDAEVVGAGAGTHLCVSGTNSNNVGCFALTAGLPATTPVNTIAVTNVRGMRIAPNGCGIAGVGSANTVQGFSVAAGTITATNTAATTTNPRYGAISDDGTLAAFGGFGSQFTLFSVNGACSLTLVGSDAGAPGTSLVEYMAFDETNRLFVSDSLANQIRVFAPTGAGIGAVVSTSTTNHGTVNAPSGIDAASIASLPVELMKFSVD